MNDYVNDKVNRNSPTPKFPYHSNSPATTSKLWLRRHLELWLRLLTSHIGEQREKLFCDLS